jgi:ATP-dependent Clp protease adapter protein ClpS
VFFRFVHSNFTDVSLITLLYNCCVVIVVNVRSSLLLRDAVAPAAFVIAVLELLIKNNGKRAKLTRRF